MLLLSSAVLRNTKNMLWMFSVFFNDTSESQIVCVKKFSHVHLLQEGTFARETVIEVVGTEFYKL